ncbi:MAG: MFS transporter [Halobacteriovoraceae bacterium]|jgi:2-oxoisovalerate dehydrogenase E1 component|nr:MFS transporter [Halobacteriovoraceae bacterium]
MFNRAKIIDDNFQEFLNNNEKIHPSIIGEKNLSTSSLTSTQLIDLLETQMMSRLLDIKSRELRAIGKSFYTIASSGHEGMAVVGLVSRLSDMAFLHYRDCALMVQRSKKKHGHTILNDLLTSFGAFADDPISGGRHKVLGSKELFIPPQTSTIASHLPKAVGTALSIARTKHLGLKGEIPADAVSFCTFGDASLNHASAQSALNCAHWISYQNIPLPLVFICEDNHIGISVPTPSEWVKNSQSSTHSMKYFECNGLNLIETFEVTKKAFTYARTWKKPCFLRIKTVRLLGHAGSDIETSYHSLKHIEIHEEKDPLKISAQLVYENNLLSSQQLTKMYSNLKERINRIAKDVIKKNILQSAEQIMHPIQPRTKIKVAPEAINQIIREKIFANDWPQLSNTPHSMGRLINLGLTDIMAHYPYALIFGEDVAKKGGVYNVTAKLEKRFGRKRVFNSLLDETSILGTAIGLAHNGFLPIPEIQFLAYIHNAQDQLRGEAATLSFFSNAQYTNGMVIRVAGLAYQKGFGGHFHNDNSLTIFRDLPGVIVACPSNGADAVMMMRSCVKEAYEHGKICVFVEPIALYPIRDLHESGDAQWSFDYPKNIDQTIPVGKFLVEGKAKELCILSYGNGFYLSNQAKKILKEKYKIDCKLIDLRWITQYDEITLSEELSKSEHVLIVDECRKSGSVSEALVTMMVEKCHPLPKISRLCGHDTYIPLGDAANLVLPQVEDIIASSLNLLGRKS